ncbi:hypothetical protein [Nonomuraea sp. MG754425]|uniref:hypothetical protein n=1 Tax=Nonomuraea sp. MG754425 TaxID=2570319 RepID=UPI001F36357C|nr:hypothetical protein [Nonomuraea sp. MG754425]
MATSVTPPATTSRQALARVAAGKRPSAQAASLATSTALKANSEVMTSALATQSVAPAASTTSSAAHQPGTPAAEKLLRFVPTRASTSSHGAQIFMAAPALSR